MAETLHCRKSGCNRVLEVFVALMGTDPNSRIDTRMSARPAASALAHTGVEPASQLFRFIAIGCASWNSTRVTGDVRWLPAPKANRISTCTHLPNRARFASGRLLAAQQPRSNEVTSRSTCTFAPTSSTMLNADVFHDRQEM